MNTPPEHPADREQPTDRLAILDGRDALAFVVIRPAEEDPERIAVEASARGISKAVAAYALRQTADQFDRAAIAEEPVDTFADTEETPEAAARRFARRLAAVERLCAGRPGYHTITVKALLTAMSNPDEDVTLVPYRGEHGYPEGESPAEQPTAPHPLTSNERRFLTFALDRAADTMRNEDGFTDADEDALTRLRDLAEVEQEPRILTVDEDEAAYYAARAELGLHARRIGSVTLNDALTAAFAAVGILTPPPAPAADTCPAMFATRAGEWQQCTGAPDHDPADGHDNGEWSWPDGQTYATPEDDAEAQR